MTRTCGAIAILVWSLAGAVPAAAQTVEAATRARLETLLTAAPETPGGQGLLPTAIAEARAVVNRAVAAEQAGDLAALHEAADAILAAIEPGTAGGWYGIRRATQESAAEMSAVQGDRAADAQRTVPRVQDAARNVLAWCDALAEVAQQLRQTTELSQAQALAPTLRRLAQQILRGRDVDGDGRVTFAAGEAGLQLLQVSVRTRAAVPPPRAGATSPVPPAGEVTP